ncbi:MAG: hypothetical protein KGJ60_00055 [Verrucomicrobiota bacterium]|nr:hypothetical protein [Verrucomicrobiota bacterium]
MTIPLRKPKSGTVVSLSRVFWPVAVLLCLLRDAPAQTVFLDFNTAGQYTGNFNPWNDSSGSNGGNYSFAESPTAGVGGGGGVSVFQSTDTTAAYKSGGWDFSTNGATITLSLLLQANGQASGNKIQLGVMNVNDNGLNNNAGVAFESFRFIPSSATVWSLREQYRTGGAMTETPLGTVNVTVGRWYQFVVSLANTAGAAGNYSAVCALYDFGADGLTPGTNLVAFPTLRSNTGQTDVTIPAVWPAFRAFQNAGVGAWDNFLAFTKNSRPVLTIPLANTTVFSGQSATFNAFAEGPGAIAYAWFTNNVLVSGATGPTYATPPAGIGFTNVTVVASNGNGSATNSATVNVVVPEPPQIASLPATNVQSFSATLGGQVLSTGGLTTTVTLCYGATDGGTNAADWEQSVSLGAQSGAFSQTVALAAGTNYFFTVEASNAVGVAWAAPSRSFATSNSVTTISFFGNGTNWTLNQSGLSSANISGNVFLGTDGNGGEAVTVWYDGLVNINGFVATFTYQDVGGSPGNDADGLSFDLQESGPTFLGTGGSNLAINGLVPSANWELNLYEPNGIGIIYHTNGASSGYLPTGAVNVSSGDPINFTIAYAPGGAVQETLADTVTGASFTTNYNVGDITALLGSSFAYIGFSSSAGGVASAQTVSNFAYQVESNGFPPAVVTNLPATGIQPSTATLNGQVLSSGGFAPAITFYYGPTDGGTNAASWANRSALGVETGTFSQVIGGLSPTTTYYYTVSASNVGGTSWASPSQTFATTAATLPQVTNAPATAIGGTLATLNGEVLSTGGVPTTVILYYGLADGGANAGTWDHTISLGLQSGAYSETINGLSSNTLYYFTAEAANSQGAVWAAPSQKFTTVASNPVFSAVAVLTQHNDNNRSGDNLNEIVLNVADVNTNQFGLLYSRPVDDQIYAQPLVMTNVSVPGRGTRNLVIVATVNDTVYAYDADDPAVTQPYWTDSFIAPPNIVPPRNTDMTGACGGNYHDFTGNIGIVGTPVIDPAGGTIYLLARTKEISGTTTNFVQRLHALDVATGAERSNSPVVVTATYPGAGDGSAGGMLTFDPQRENQRCALALANGIVYITWASHCDWGPYHGWVIGYNATNLQRAVTYVDTPNGSEGGVWMSGQAPAADANGNIYVTTGNGTVDAMDYGESFLKLTPAGGMTVASYFTPYNWQALNNGDTDLGCAGMLLIPGTTLAMSGGKEGILYLVNRDNMGGLSGSTTADTNIVQSWSLNSSQIHGGPVWWAGPNGSFIYVWPQSNDHLRQYQFSNGRFNTNAYALGPSAGGSGSSGGVLSVSANGTNAGSGIVWAAVNTTASANQATVTGTLHAYNAQNVSEELWNSDMVSRDSLGSLAKFVPPTVANGKVYMATFSDRLNVYGLLPPPSLGIGLSGGNAVLSWPANTPAGFTLEASTNLPSGNWTVVTNAVVASNGVFQVTAPASGPAIFYRLKL